MGLFSSAKDLFNGITPSNKKKYSSFFSAVLLHYPDFKIIKAEDGGGEAIVELLSGQSKIEILIRKNPEKIDELRTTIFDFINDTSLLESKNKFIKGIVSYHDFKMTNSKARGTSEREYLSLLSRLSYLNYILRNNNKELLQKCLKIQGNRIGGYNKPSMFSRLVDDPFLKLDSVFKGMNHINRLRLANTYNDLSSFQNWDNNLYQEQKKYEAFGYHYNKDVWFIKLTIKKNNNVLFEDIVITDGENGNDLYMHEDDFLYFSEAIEKMKERCDFFK
jgi:hypothetical protein